MSTKKKKAKRAKTSELGQYQLGARWVRVRVNRAEGGGAFWCCPEGGGSMRMEIGLKHQHFSQAIEVALHEALEAAFHLMKCRYEASGNFTLGNDAYLFLCTHPQFSELVAQASYFLGRIYADLKRAFLAAQKQEKT